VQGGQGGLPPTGAHMLGAAGAARRSLRRRFPPNPEQLLQLPRVLATLA
jgi:hypothetical protein